MVGLVVSWLPGVGQSGEEREGSGWAYLEATLIYFMVSILAHVGPRFGLQRPIFNSQQHLRKVIDHEVTFSWAKGTVAIEPLKLSSFKSTLNFHSWLFVKKMSFLPLPRPVQLLTNIKQVLGEDSLIHTLRLNIRKDNGQCMDKIELGPTICSTQPRKSNNSIAIGLKLPGLD